MIFNYYKLSKTFLLLSLMAIISLSAFAQDKVCNVEVKFEKTVAKDKIENVEVQVIQLDEQTIVRPDPLKTGNFYYNVSAGNLIVSVFRNTSILDAQINTNRISLDCSKVDKTGLKTIYISLPIEKSVSTNEGFAGIDTYREKSEICTIDNSKVINGEAIHLEKPKYPKSAVAANVKGSVDVRVIIDKQGNVIFARAFNGHPLLRNASENAAVKSKFKPTLLEDQPIEVSGIIVYNFN